MQFKLVNRHTNGGNVEDLWQYDESHMRYLGFVRQTPVGDWVWESVFAPARIAMTKDDALARLKATQVAELMHPSDAHNVNDVKAAIDEYYRYEDFDYLYDVNMDNPEIDIAYTDYFDKHGPHGIQTSYNWMEQCYVYYVDNDCVGEKARDVSMLIEDLECKDFASFCSDCASFAQSRHILFEETGYCEYQV